MTNKLFTVSAVILLAVGIAWWSGQSAAPDSSTSVAAQPAGAPAPGMAALEIPASYLAESSDDGAHLNQMIVYKSPTCGCCSLWIEHLERNGFEVEARDNPAMAPIKQELGVPQPLVSCHTAVIAGRVVEGHVPADVIRDFLADEEAYASWAGIAVPGMPVGSPGMEVEGRSADAYDVIAFDREGNTTVFASR
jgi:hypothetical protein